MTGNLAMEMMKMAMTLSNTVSDNGKTSGNPPSTPYASAPSTTVTVMDDDYGTEVEELNTMDNTGIFGGHLVDSSGLQGQQLQKEMVRETYPTELAGLTKANGEQDGKMQFLGTKVQGRFQRLDIKLAPMYVVTVFDCVCSLGCCGLFALLCGIL